MVQRLAPCAAAASLSRLTRRIVPLLSALLTAAGAGAQGFAIDDLAPIGDAAAAKLGPGYVVRAAAARAILYCADCPGAPMIDILLGKQTDGTEARVRAGVTAMADLERLCRARNDGCRIRALDLAPAVGWLSRYPLARGQGSTAVILRGGSVLTVRVVVSDGDASGEIIEHLLPLIRERIIGR